MTLNAVKRLWFYFTYQVFQSDKSNDCRSGINNCLPSPLQFNFLHCLLSLQFSQQALLWVKPPVILPILQWNNKLRQSRNHCLGWSCVQCLKCFSFISSNFIIISGRRRNLVPRTLSWLKVEVLFLFHLRKRKKNEKIKIYIKFYIHIKPAIFFFAFW